MKRVGLTLVTTAGSERLASTSEPPKPAPATPTLASTSPLPAPAVPEPSVDWPLFRFSLDRAGYNPAESVLRPPLELKWQFDAKGKI